MPVDRISIGFCALLAALVVAPDAPAAASAPLAVSSYRSTMNYRAASRATSRAAELRRYCRAHPRVKKCVALRRAEQRR